jgi:hypothetical protein
MSIFRRLSVGGVGLVARLDGRRDDGAAKSVSTFRGSLPRCLGRVPWWNHAVFGISQKPRHNGTISPSQVADERSASKTLSDAERGGEFGILCDAERKRDSRGRAAKKHETAGNKRD